MAKKTNTKGGKGKTPTKGSKGQKGQKNPKKGGKQDLVKVTKTERVFKQKTRPVPTHIDLTKEGSDFKQIVRLVNRDVPGYLSIGNGIKTIYGVSDRLGKVIDKVFCKKIGKDIKKIGYLSEEEIILLEETLLNIDKEVPAWMINRSKTSDGRSLNLIMADLKLEIRKDLQKLGKMKSYRGLRLQWGLTVRGQKTKSSFRRSGAVGVTKKK
jgi:small subunit ribosomal protein S13